MPRACKIGELEIGRKRGRKEKTRKEGRSLWFRVTHSGKLGLDSQHGKHRGWGEKRRKQRGKEKGKNETTTQHIVGDLFHQ